MNRKFTHFKTVMIAGLLPGLLLSLVFSHAAMGNNARDGFISAPDNLSTEKSQTAPVASRDNVEGTTVALSLHDELQDILKQANSQLKPKLKITPQVNGIPAPPNIVNVDIQPKPISKSRNLLYFLQKNETYHVRVTCEVDDGSFYTAFEDKVKAHYHGTKELPAKIELVDGLRVGKDWTIPELEMEFVSVKPGIFEMGSKSEEADNDEKPVHSVKISQPFWIGKYEVTQAEADSLERANPSKFQGDNRPLERVSWDYAARFCRLLTQRERSAGRLPAGYQYRLPTEAEWEYAARGGHKASNYKYSGSNDIAEVAWYRQNSNGETREVGKKAANELGIHDMSGNVWEWCLDWNDSHSYKQSKGQGIREDPVNTDKSFFRIYRGGGWDSPARACRSSYRDGSTPTDKINDLGFRIVLAPIIPED